MHVRITLIFCLFSIVTIAQTAQDETLRFKYDGIDAKVSRIRADNMYFGSLGLSSFEYETYNMYVPVLFSVSGEFGKRIFYLGKIASLSFNVTPHIGVSHLFAGKLGGTANLNLFNYSNYDNTHNLGLLGGAGYEVLFSSFNNGGFYPVARGGFIVDNFRFVYQQALSINSNSKYTITFSSKLDF